VGGKTLLGPIIIIKEKHCKKREQLAAAQQGEGESRNKLPNITEERSIWEVASSGEEGGAKGGLRYRGLGRETGQS